MITSAELYVLQEIDLAIDSSSTRLAVVEEQLGETEELRAAREVTGEKRRALGALSQGRKDLEWQVDEVRSKASVIDKKLYGGTVRNPKELADLQADLMALQSQVRRREDSLLNVLLEVEEAEGELKAEEVSTAAIEAGWREEQEALSQERGQLIEELAELKEKRSGQDSGYDEGALELYALLRLRRDGRAVAKVERGMCGGCRITLPISALHKARAGVDLVQCVSCERILYIS